ncbi:TIGR03746 family integrating conjugative element protein [Pseudomonas sp. GOM7]|uniref:PFL_4703 family integrating conjugative element protein n=1 Tax=Pseudomonas sp. GOM7 TaxID=2998079 RepID=UPI00227A5905|nr:TIGR03746 family integrating conjugative element protein [Pseudomonas sp. GOM7]WAJ37268.1 TIGR03746 family integrating conjugative element protein [Pseudomonas sp. GOM7]
MSRYKRALDERDSHIKTLRIGCGILIGFCLLLAYGWYSAPKNLTVHNPPDLRSGSTREWWVVPPSTVYSFAYYIFQQLNRWQTDGSIEYEQNIYNLQALLTPSCRAFLEADASRRKAANELLKRERSVYEIPGRGFKNSRVDVEGRDSWVVYLDLVTDEHYMAEPVKSTLVRYPIRVVRNDVDPELNPWGLQLDCYAEVPQLLSVVREGEQ